MADKETRGNWEVKILLVTADDETEKNVGATLAEGVFKLITARSVRDGILCLNREKPITLILSDLNLPDVDGFQFLDLLRNNSVFKEIPVFALSDNSEESTVVKCARLGAKDFIPKPIGSVALLAKIRKSLFPRTRTVLVVDDDDIIRELLKRLLERHGFKALTAADGKRAMEIVRSGLAGLVISDIEMPGMNGLELLAQIKEHNTHLPVYMITGRAGKYSEQFVLDSGADGFIAKPFRNTDIIERVTAALRQTRADSVSS